ncbi:tetratricopeptide repeat protein [Nannocystaceae bacterium ST9]
MSAKTESGVEQSFAAALRAAENAPDSDDAWDHLEELAETLQRPEAVAKLYRDLLERLPKDGARALASRAVNFHEEWFGDEPEVTTALLNDIISHLPEETWAFDRLTVSLTANEKWDELLAVYDRTLAVTKDKDQRKQLLDDAARVAKDFANQPARAADYMVKRLELDRSNTKLEASLARLLERQERWADLIELWRGRLGQLGPVEARALRVEIAGCYLDKLGDPAKTLDEIESLLEESAGHADACALLERLLEHGKASLPLRRRALSLLRKNYDAAERPSDVIRVLERALNFVNEDEKPGLYRELGSRLGIAGEDSRAMQHYAALLTIDPTDADARKQIRQLAERSGEHRLYALALVAAAEASEEGAQQTALLLEAAHAHRDLLDDKEQAIELYSRVLDSEQAEKSSLLAAAHSLAELLTDAGEDQRRLSVLERLADLERVSAVRRTILGEAARLAERLGQADRALANWTRRLAGEDTDLEARDAVVELLQTNQRWSELVDALLARAADSSLEQQRRSDLIRAAKIQSEQLGQIEAAIETWLNVRKSFGDEPEILDALDRLLTKTQRWKELAELLAGSAGTGRDRAARMLTRLGDICRQHLGDPDRAADYYAKALGVDAANHEGLAGLRALLDVPSCAPLAGEALAQAFRITGDWEAGLAILEERLAAAPSAMDKARLLAEASKLYEQRAGDLIKARAAVAKALPFSPDDLSLEHDLLRLTEDTDEWAETAQALRDAAEGDTGSARAAWLLLQSGKILEQKLADPVAATDAYAEAAKLDPKRVDSQEAVSRCAARAGRWREATSAALRAIIAHERPDTAIIEALEQSAGQAKAFGALADSFELAIAEQTETLRPTLTRALEMIVARWWEQAGQHARASEAARRAVDHEATHGDALETLAAMQRREPGPALIETLLRIDALDERGLGALREAAEVALAGGDDRIELTRVTMVRLYRKAARMWSRGEEARGELQPEAAARWALDRLVELCAAAGEHDQAVRLLLDGATLPIDPEVSRDMRRRAAEMLAEAGEYGRAIDLYTGVLAEDEPRLEDIARVASLCEQEDRVSELIGLRLRELEMTEDGERRLELRLELSRLTGVLEARGGRVETLRENLEEHPGHAESIAALSELLDQRGRYDELAEVLEQQATRVGAAGDTEQAAALWGRVAELAEKRLRDNDKAIAAYRKVVELRPDNQALDALARLYLALDRPDAAAKHLEQRLETAPESERVALLLKLARARLAAEQREKAVQALDTAFGEAPRNGEVRKLLIRLHRERDDKPALARTLATAATAVGDPTTVVAYAREAAELYEELGNPEVAVPVLERAHEFAPDDRHIKLMLADGLRGAGRLDEARTLLGALIESFGRRRSAQRAEVHVRLARVAQAQGKPEEAIDELEEASKMAPGNVAILRALAQTAHAAGQLDRAERAYRTLLLSLRRGGEEATPISPAEIYLELATIAGERGDDEKAEELRESILEAVAEDDTQAPKVQKALRARGQFEVLRRVLDTRLVGVKTPRKRARILAELGDVLERDLGRDDQALDARLSAVEADPSSPVLHEAVKDLAIRLGKTERYQALLEHRLSLLRRGDEALVRAELLLRLGEVMASREQWAKADELFGQAEETGVRQVDVWRAQAKVAGARGDAERQVELLQRLANLGADQAETRADARFRMAEVLLADPEAIDEGIGQLNAALEDDPRWGRAALILGHACEQHGDNDSLLDFYEKVARRSDDAKILLHCLERRARQSEASLERVREAVDLATKLGQGERAEELMLRAVELSKGLIDGAAQVDWALLALAHRRRLAGDLAGAVKWLIEAAEVASLAEVVAAAAELTPLATGPEGDLTLAVKLYESLVERDPTNRTAWEPLARFYRQLGEVGRLERLVEETLDGIQDAKDRNVLRLELARALLAAEGRADDAVPILNDALLENPEETAANILLAEHLERSGNVGELIDLLRNQLMAAQGRNDTNGIKQLSLELANRLRISDLTEALMVIRQALDSLPGDGELVDMLLAWGGDQLDDDERAGLMERQLEQAEGDRIAKLALDLADLRARMGDEAGELRVVEQTWKRLPDDAKLLARLEATLRKREDWKGLVRMLEGVAGRTNDTTRKIALLREAAVVQRDQLGDAQAAIAALRKASQTAPDDVGLQIELATALGVSGQAHDAIATLSETLERTQDARLRLELLGARAKVRRSIGERTAAIEDLEQAVLIDQSAVIDALIDALEAQRMAAAGSSDTDAERPATMRLVELRIAAGEREAARELLAEWVDRQRRDLEALHALRRLELDMSNWEGLQKVSGRLVALEAGEAQVEAALLLARACRELGRPADARQGLEFARRKQPEIRSLRTALQEIYAAIGADKELADLLIEQVSDHDDNPTKLDLLRRAAKLYFGIGDAAAAAVPLRAILEIDPTDAESVGLLADAYTNSGQLDAAEQIIDAAIESAPAGRSPELASLQLRKARLAAARGDRDTQLAVLQLAFGNDKQNGFIAAELADLAEEIENWDLATKVLRQIALMEGVECPISRAMSFVRQGRISLIQGDAKRAVFWARRAIKEDPELAEAQTLLTDSGG